MTLPFGSRAAELLLAANLHRFYNSSLASGPISPQAQGARNSWWRKALNYRRVRPATLPVSGGPRKDSNMSNQVVLITGGLTGIGRAAVVAFAKKGAKVVIAGRRDEAGARPLKRGAKPEEIADAIVFLASDKASFVTGQIIRINGGKTAM